ncbi:ABC transporter B family member 11-like isoform X1 [Carex rostrata]
MGGKDTEEKKEENNGAEGKVSIFKMLQFADRFDVLLMVVGSIAALANGISQPMMTFIFGQTIDAFGGGTSSDILNRVNSAMLNFVYLAIGTGITATLQVACWTMTGERQATRIRGLYLKAVLRQDIAYFDKEITTGKVTGRISSDTVLIQDAIGEKVGKCLQLVSTFIGGFVVAFIKGWLLSLVMLSSIPPIVFAGAALTIMISKVLSKGQAAYSDAGSVVEQTLSNMKTVASFNGENRAVSLYDKHINKTYQATAKEGAANGFGMGSVFLIIFASYGLAIWYGGQLIINKGYSGGTVISVLLAVLIGASSLGNAAPCVTAFAEGQTAAYWMFETIKRKPDIDAYDESGVTLEKMNGDVELRDVYFSYPARPEQLIFNGFSLRVDSGTTMAIVGESGSGKSTVISLVERFYDPQAGEVLIDGVNIKTLKLGWIREKIGLVSQEPLLFMTTIKDNILYGKEGATLEEVTQAVELANAANFIDKLPDGLDTMVGQRGAQLSGGQKQRIAIARAILKNPKILLLDEATSALDVESERIVQEALDRIMVERTTLVVAHRLSTVRNADRISVMHEGKIVEQGPHDELTKDPDGAYSQLIRLQEASHEGKDHHHVSTSKSYSHSASLKRSLSRRLSGASSKHLSFNLPFTTPGLTPDDEDADEGYGDKSAPKKAPVGRLMSLNKPEFPVLIMGSISAAVHGVLFPMSGLIIASAIEAFFQPPHKLRKDTSFWALMCVVLGIGSIISIPAEYFLFAVAGGKLVERIRSLSFQSIVRQEVSWFDDPGNSSGKIGARLSMDALNVRRLVGDTLALIAQTLATLICGFVVAMVANWQLALIITVVIPLVGLQAYAQVKFLKGFSTDAKVMYEEASQIASDAVSSIRTVASFCAEKRIIETYNHKCEASMNQGVRTGWISGLGFGFSFLVLYLTFALCFYVGAKFVEKDKATFTEVFKVFFALLLTTTGISQTSALGSDSAKARDSAISIFEIVDRKSKIDPGSEEGQVLEIVRGDIELRHISFRYPTRPDVPIFTNLYLSIPSGKTIALVGESGSGKSTVIALLERFYDPDSGNILLDGTEITTLNVSWLRKQMGLVSQEPVLFDDTIRANISYGKEGEVTEEELIAVAEASNAHQFISSLPQGYDTYVGERGIQLSGGQKQRVAIARAILKNPKILLLDEATSALDAESEHVVQEALDRVMVGRTTIVVAHRLSTIKGADIIAVVKNGEIVEKGRHETLMRIKDGVYASLVELRSN